jgi:hypothetical protein
MAEPAAAHVLLLRGHVVMNRTRQRLKWVRDVDWKGAIQDFLIVLIAVWSLVLFIALIPRPTP